PNRLPSLGAGDLVILLSLFSLPAPAPECISYAPQLSSATLAGRLTQSTFTLEQPRGQFSHLNISDFDAIWLVLAHSNGGHQNFTAPRRVEDTPVPANFPQTGYYVTLRPGNQLWVLHVGNDTHCSPMTRGLQPPPAGPGPLPVTFLVVRDRGPMAETEWSSETRLQQAEALQAAPGPQSAGTVVIIAILSVLPAILLTALLPCSSTPGNYDTCGSMSISGPGELVCMRRYNTHHMFSPSAEGGF
uniref:Uroplakin 3B n=1 Tax=Balaenoptera musculus TaxID=9771 RepID=A0A8C0D1C4_BALMU